MSVLVTYGVGKSYLESKSKVALAEEGSLEQQADDARAMFAKGNYVTILDHEKLSRDWRFLALQGK